MATVWLATYTLVDSSTRTVSISNSDYFSLETQPEVIPRPQIIPDSAIFSYAEETDDGQ